MTRHTACVLSTENLLHNLAVLCAHAPRSKIMAMVKANAYGHGLRSVSQRLDEHVDALGVASIDEALILRQCGVKSPIVLMEGVFTPDELRLAAEQKFQVVFHNPQQIQWLQGNPPATRITAWLKIDTGLGRLGFLPEAVDTVLHALSDSKALHQPIGILSHFACADEPAHPLNGLQSAAFRTCVQGHDGSKSLCNSAGIFAFPDQHYDWVRPGLALYGASPLNALSPQALDLKPVMTFTTRLIAIRHVKRGASVGYGARYICPEDMAVGIIAAGYGDGYPRTARDGTPVLINDRLCPLVGRVSMDMAAVDLRAYPTAAVNDTVTLWGKGLPVDTVAKTTKNTPYDLLTAVQNRVKFSWSGS